MDDEKDRFGEKMRLAERAKEDIYFAERDRELLEKLRSRLRRTTPVKASTPVQSVAERSKVSRLRASALDRCSECGGIWLDRGELEGIVRKISRGPLAEWLHERIEKT